MWRTPFVQAHNAKGTRLRLTDDLPSFEDLRGGSGVSCRLIVEKQGFLDIADMNGLLLDFNGA